MDRQVQIAGMPRSSRDGTLDLARGLALIFMLVDHIVPNILSELTPKNFGFSDMAEVFVFVSGVSCGIVYSRRYNERGFLSCQRKALQRIVQIYTAYLVTMLILRTFGGQEHGQPDYSGEVYSITPDVIKTILMNHTYSDLGILLLYMIFLLFTPVAIVLCAHSKSLVLAGSALLYLAVQAPAFQGFLAIRYSGLFMEPAAWQVLFFVGLVAGAFKNKYDWPLSQSRALLWLSLLIIQVSFLVKVIWWDSTIPYTDKSTLGLFRVAHILALATLAGSVSGRHCQEYIRRTAALRIVCAVGRNALFAFCIGEIIANISVPLLRFTGYHVGAQIIVTIIAVLLNCTAAVIYGEFRESSKVNKRRQHETSSTI